MSEKYYIYRFMDNKGNILYIGRTNNIERRILKEHFTDLGHLPEECYKSISKIEYTEIYNESEEIAYEAILINKVRPFYNTQFKDEGNFNIDLPEFDWEVLDIDDAYFKYLKTRKDKTVQIESLLPDIIRDIGTNKDDYSVTTGFKEVDAVTNISKSDLILVASDEGIGKTTYAINIALHLSRNKNLNVLYLNLKESEEKVTERIISRISEISIPKIKKGMLNDNEWEKFTQSTEELTKMSLKLGNLSYEDKNIDKIIEIIKNDIYDFIVIDELESIHSNEPIYSKDKMHIIMDKLNSLSNDIRTPIMTLCQLSSEKIRTRMDKRPIKLDLKYDSLRIFPDIITFLYFDQYYNPDTKKEGIIEVITDKNRCGYNSIVELKFIKEKSLLLDLSDKN
mgnify:CR=1 FL=1